MAIKSVSIQPGRGRSIEVNILIDQGLPMDKQGFWWVRYPKRAAVELYKMSIGTNSLVQVDGNKLIWFEYITSNFGKESLIAIETGPNYPFTMPKVFVREPKISSLGSKHMYGDGSLCLMHADDYNSRMSVLDIRNQAAAWLTCTDVYKEIGEWVGAERPH